MINIYVEIIGWVAALLILGAYFLNMYGFWKTTSFLYILFNLVGGIFFVINTFFHKAYPSMVVNIIWALIAIAAFFKKDKSA
jgi:hypothetical protein